MFIHLPKLSTLTTTCAMALGMFYGCPAAAVTLDLETSSEFTGESFDWLMTEGMTTFLPYARDPGASDPEALAFVTALFRENDNRASTALQGYFNRYPNDPAAFDLAGTDLMRQGNYETAVIAFRRALDLDRFAHWTRAKLGTSLILNGQHQDGLTELHAVNRQDPENPLALRYLAWDAINAGNLSQAIIYSERALSTFGLPVDQVNQAHLDLAALYGRAGRHFDITTLLGRAVRNSALDVPTNVQLEVFGTYFDAALALGDTPNAKIALDRLGGLVGPDAPQIRLSRARVHLQDGEAGMAKDIIEDLRLAYPGMASDLVPDLALAEAANGDLDSAIHRLGALADVRGPGADIPLIRMALTLLLDADENDMAFAFIDARKNLAPARPDVAVLAVEARLEADAPAQALGLATVLTERFPDVAQAHFLLGTSQYRTGDRDAAVASYRQTLTLAPQSPDVWLTLLGTIHSHESYSHDDTDDHADVEALLREAIAANPDSALLHNELGLMFLSDGNLDSAIEAFDAALQRSPGYLPSLTLGALARADAGTDLDQAGLLITFAKQLMPGNVVTQDVEGWIAYQRGEHDTARDLLGGALAAEPGDATTRYHWAVLNANDGDTAKARDDLLIALKGDLYQHYADGARDLLVSIGPADEITTAVHRLDGSATGTGDSVGTMTIVQTDDGVEFRADLAGFAPGGYAAHVHLRPTCAPQDGVIGGAAGAHFGHDGMMHDMSSMSGAMHMMPDGTMMSDAMSEVNMGDVDSAEMATDPPMTMTPRGDLAPFVFEADQTSTTMVVATQLSLDEIRGRSLMIHEGIDIDGQSGPKIACAIIP